MPLKAAYPNHVWTYDFMEEAAAGRKLRLLTIVDEFTRENLEIAVARSLPARAVIAVLARGSQTASRAGTANYGVLFSIS